MAALKVNVRRQWPALLWLALIVGLAVLAPYLPLPYPPADPDLLHIGAAPFSAGSRHWLGTDAQGRDVLANLVFGARTVVLFTLPAAVLAAALGALAGSAAGFWRNDLPVPRPCWVLALGAAWWALALPYAGAGLALGALALGWAGLARVRRRPLRAWPLPLDALVLGAVALLGAIPRLILVLAVAGLGLEPTGLAALLVLTTWPDSARLVRAETLRARAQPFVEAAYAVGLPPGRIWWRHVLRHAVQPLRAALPLSIAGLVGLENTLSFLGIGLPPTVASWGRMLGSARLDLNAWWLVAFPGTLLALSIISLHQLAKHQSD